MISSDGLSQNNIHRNVCIDPVTSDLDRRGNYLFFMVVVLWLIFLVLSKHKLPEKSLGSLLWT